MGNVVVTGGPAPQSPPARLRLRRGKKNSGCPCFLSEQASTWEKLTSNDSFRPFVLRHLLDESFVCSVLENGEREHSSDACEGVVYYKYMQEDYRTILAERLEAWQRAAGAGMVACDGLTAEAAFAELQLAGPPRAHGFLPTLQRRLALLRELGAVVLEEQRSSCRPFHMRLRSPPPPGGGQEQGDVRLALTMNAVALQSLKTLASLATAIQRLPAEVGGEYNNWELIRAPFAMLANMLGEFPTQSLFKFWSPAPAEPERRMSVDPDTATASNSASLARLAVSGGLHVSWKSTSTGSAFVTWQVALSKPSSTITSVSVQWGAGDPSTGNDQHAVPVALSVEASIDGGKEWHGITGGDEAVDRALVHRASAGSSRHRYPVSLLSLRRREHQSYAPEEATIGRDPAVTHIRLKMRGAPSTGSAGALRMYDVGINVRDDSARQSDVMTVLRQVQSFLLAQHAQDPAGLQDYILRALLGVCQASCALEFELDLVRVYMDMEDAAIARLARETKDGAGNCEAGSFRQSLYEATHGFGAGNGLKAFLSTLVSAACRVKRLACRQGRERVVRDARFDPAMSSKWVAISEGGQLVSSADSGHSHSLVHQCLRRGIWSWVLGLERESHGDETTCVGVAVHPVTNSCYEDSHQMWMVRCYSGETYSNGGRRNLVTCKIHPLDSIRLTLNCEGGTLSLEVNGIDQGVVFSNVPAEAHPAVCFYGMNKSVRLAELKRMDGESDSDTSDSEGEADTYDSKQQMAEERKEPTTATNSVDSVADTCDTTRGDGVAVKETSESIESSPSSCLRMTNDVDGRTPKNDLHNRRRRRTAAQVEEQDVAASIYDSLEVSASTGLLAGLSNLAQWFVPQDEYVTQRDQRHSGVSGESSSLTASQQRALKHTAGSDCSVADRAVGVDYGTFISGDGRVPEARRRVSLNDTSDNERWRPVSPADGVSDPLRHMMLARRLSTARTMSISAASRDDISARSDVDSMEHRRGTIPARTTVWAPALMETVRASPSTYPAVSKAKALSLEEPYAIQPTAVVFLKLYGLLTRSLAKLRSGNETDESGAVPTTADQALSFSATVESAQSTVRSLLQIMRANFCRLVDAHVDPAEVGLLLESDQGHQTLEHRGSDSLESVDDLLPNIRRCLQGIMLQDQSKSLLLHTAIDTFSSGLPLLMPRVADRLHLLLALVRHLQSRRDGERSRLPQERVTLLRNLLQHFSRTEAVLQLLALFEKEEVERDAISDLLELMLISLADKACLRSDIVTWQRAAECPAGHERNSKGLQEPPTHAGASEATQVKEAPLDGRTAGGGGNLRTRADDPTGRDFRSSVRHRSHWEQLVASGTAGTALDFTFLETCQQHLLCMVLGRDRTEDNPFEILLCQYGQYLLQVCCRVLSLRSLPAEEEDDGSAWWHLVGVLLPPFLHGLCMCSDRSRVAEGMLPPLVRISAALSERIAQSPMEAIVASMADEMLHKMQLRNPEEGLALAPSGWHPVRASFEVDKDCMTSFAVSEDGQLYSALTSSNTCALVDVGVSQGKAAWEFLLEDDTHSDECSVFGIATKPVYSRCYNSSPYLRMRRAYNGVLYDRGQQLPGSHNMSKVHPGDVLRCEVDMDEGTVRFRINGEKQEGGFDGVEGEVFPCAGSYRSGVTIRLLKMEIMGGAGLIRGSDEAGTSVLAWDPTQISWASGPFSKATRGGLVSIDKKAMELRRMHDVCLPRRQWSSRSWAASTAAYLDRDGCHQASAVADGHPSSSLSSIRQESDAILHGPDEAAERPIFAENGVRAGIATQIADAGCWDWVSVQTTRGCRASQGKHSVEMEVTPAGVGRRRPLGNTRAGNNAERNSLRRYPMAFGLSTRHIPSHDCPIGLFPGSWAWWTDGSLRTHGEVHIPAKRRGQGSIEGTAEATYGLEFLPLKSCDVITMVLDTFNGTVRYLVNGVDAGVAFGPPGSTAVCVLPADKAPFAWDDGAVLFPSCSLTNDKQVVQLRPAGTLGTLVWPLSVDLHKTVASLAGRLCATMVAGTPQDDTEVALEPWLRSPLLSGGVEVDEDVMGSSARYSLGRRTWNEAWNGRQGGRSDGTQSSAAWGSGTQDVRTADKRSTRHGKRANRQRDPAFGSEHRQICLSVGVKKATRVSQGLVMWPEDPLVRLIAVVDGRDDNAREEVLVLSRLIDDAVNPRAAGDTRPAHDGGTEEQTKEKFESLLLDEEVWCGQQQHVFVLPIARASSGSGDNNQSDAVHSVSLRAEVLVGGIVTAWGLLNGLELSKELDDGHHVLRLCGGGEITLDLNVSDSKSQQLHSSQDIRQQPTRLKESGGEQEGDVARMRVDSVGLSAAKEGSCVHRFLASIASWGAETRLTSTIALEGKDGAQAPFPTAGEPSVSISAAGFENGESGSRFEIHEESSFPDLVKWLERSHPDPPFLRIALEKTGNYSFPLVEAPFVAALLKHGGLVGEALHAAKTMSSIDEEDDGASHLPSPSKDMAKLWGRVRQLRAHLRTQRQQYKVMATDVGPGQSTTAGQGSPHVNDLSLDEREGERDRTTADKESDTGQEAKQKDANLRETDFTNGGDRGVASSPKTFAQLCAQSTERANFLLGLAPSTVRCPSAAAEGTSVLMHHLAEELPDLPTPPPASLQSRLLRWRSEDHGKERWKGVVDVLRVQSQLRRCSSMSYRPRAKSLGSRPLGHADTILQHENGSDRSISSPCIREGQVLSEGSSSENAGGEMPARVGMVSLAGESGCASGDESDESGDSGLLDDATAASASLQACTIYVITGGVVAPPVTLKRSLRIRTSRAAMRIFGLEALSALIRTLAPEGVVDTSIGAQSTIQEALIFLRPAFGGLCIKGGKDKQQLEVASDEQDTHHHYLKGLEGCSASLLSGVQSAFEDLYSLLTMLLDHSLQAGQPGLAHVLMASWALDFESRDHCFLAHKSGILSTLQAMVTLTNTASLASTSLARTPSPVRASIHREDSCLSTRYRWIPWSLDRVAEGFVQGTLMARDLAGHISSIPPSALPPGFLQKSELHGDAAEILARHSVLSLVRRYSALLRVHLHHMQAQLDKDKVFAAEERKRLEKVARERVAEFVARGVPVLDEREGRKAPEVRLTAFCLWATVPMVESVACTFARGVTYMGTGALPAVEAPSVVAAITQSGNYYEVTIMNPGDKTTIGVGLADPAGFPATKQMPGWVDHSYGYHGDDGRKFGRGKTDSIWPTWVDGDVIGCGFDPAKGTIWYTRNGKLLGDGFVMVYESSLVPVVGFHSNGESVRVNFGLSPFAYEGPEVVVAPAVLAERQRLRREAQETDSEEASLGDDDDHLCFQRRMEEKPADANRADLMDPPFLNLSQEEKVSSDKLNFKPQLETVPPQALVLSLRGLQGGASSLLRFLMAVSMRQATPAVVAGSDDANCTPKQVARDEQKLLTPVHKRRETGNTDAGTAGAEVTLMHPTRERSIYGTPFKHTQPHVDSLHQDVFDLLFRELRLGALSLKRNPSSATGKEKLRTAKRQRRLEFDCAVPSVIEDATPQNNCVQWEMRRSYSHSFCLPGGAEGRSPYFRRDSHVTGSSSGDRENATANELGLLALERGEVEPHMFRHLALLCSVRHYAVSRVQLAHPSALRSLLSLLELGSPRMQRCVLLLLGAVLPGIEPAVVDNCLPEAWLRPVKGVAFESAISSEKESRMEQESPNSSGRSAPPVGGLVGVLFSTLRRAYSAVSLPGDAVKGRACHPESCRSVPGVSSSVGAGNDGVISDSRNEDARVDPKLLVPGCGKGFGGGLLDLCLAEQCGSLLRELHKEHAWKELVARMLLVSIRTAASSIRELSFDPTAAAPSVETTSSPSSGLALRDIISDAVAALAVIAGSSGVLYPGAAVESKSGARGAVVWCSPGDVEAGVLFDGQNVEASERVPVRDLEVIGAGFQTNPDTPAQPVLAQLLALLQALLCSNEVAKALRVTDPDDLRSDIPAMAWSRLLSQTLASIIQLAANCSDAFVAACQEEDVAGRLLSMLLQVAVRPIQLPALIAPKEFRQQWRAAQARMLSALHLGDSGLRTLQPIQTRPLPPPEPSVARDLQDEECSAITDRDARSPFDRQATPSTEESRVHSLTRAHRHPSDGRSSSPDSAPTRWARIGGRGRLMAMSDAHRGWGRGWGSAMHGRRTEGASGSLEWSGRSGRDEDENAWERGRRRLLRGDVSQRTSGSGRRAASVESRLNARRSVTRVFHERMRGFTEPRDEETGALLVEYNDGTDETAVDLHGVEGGSAGSAETADTSQDGEEDETSASAATEPGAAGGGDKAADTDDRMDPSSVDLSFLVPDERSVALNLRDLDEEGSAASMTRPLGFPVSHVLEFGPEAKAEREQFGAQLSDECGVSLHTVRSALEAFGEDGVRARQWLLRQQEPIDVSRQVVDHSKAAEGSQVKDDAVVSSLIGAAERGLTRGGGGEPAGVPSAEDGLNLWEPEEEAEATPLAAPGSAQNVDLLCEHDLVPVVGIPRPSPRLGGPTSTVSSSFVVKEADLLVPGTLLVVTTGEGCAPGESAPCVLVAEEMDLSSKASRGRNSSSASLIASRRGPGMSADEDRIGESDRRVAAEIPPLVGDHEDGLMMDGEEVLVETIDAETGLCFGKRVPIGELRHSISFFGRKLDVRGKTVKQLLHHSDTALSTFRARNLLVRLLHSLHTPAVAVAGGPEGLLNLSRLLASQDLAEGNIPASVWNTPDSGRQGGRRSEVESAPADGQGNSHSESERTKATVESTQLDQECLLKVLWRKVIQAPEQWTSDDSTEVGSTSLRDVLAQEVLDSFNALIAAPQILVSGDGRLQGHLNTIEKSALMSDVTPTIGKDSIVHESLHPVGTPLSYGGHIKVDPKCHGMVVKMDSRSRTSSDLMRLQFFSSKEDMLNDRNPLRVMHGHAADRAARAHAKGMEFFKIEEADSTSFDATSSSLQDALSMSSADRLVLPPPLVRQGSSSTTASVSSGSPLAAPLTPRRPGTSSRAVTRGLHDTQVQIAAKRWGPSKDGSGQAQSNSFRSFALPRVNEVWFRFDAPPGAEKPPLQFTSLAGSLDRLPSGVLRANPNAASDSEARSGVDDSEDLSQEDMGLKALFTFFGAEHAVDDVVNVEAVHRHAKGVETNEESESSECLISGKIGIPGCLAVPADVRLTGGKWFYEVTIDSLMDSSTDEDCLVRIGWAHLDLTTALQLDGTWKPREGSMSWDAGSLGVRQTEEGSGALYGSDVGMTQVAPQAAELSLRTSGNSADLLNLERTVGWVFDSKVEQSVPTMEAEDRRRRMEREMADEASASSTAAINETSELDKNVDLASLEARANSVVFPILGSDRNNMGLGVDEKGFVWLGGRPKVRATRSLQPSDVMGCALDVESGNVWFSVNGIWMMGPPHAQGGGQVPSCFKWDPGHASIGNAIRPCLSLRGPARVSVNFGTTPFKHPPPEDVFLPVALRDLNETVTGEGRSVTANQTNRVTFASEVSERAARKSSKSGVSPGESLDSDWGFRFVVDPLRGVPYMVVRELELVCRLGSGRAGAGSSSVESRLLSIWRPKAPPGWYSVGDVASRGVLPPAGAIVVRADATGCLMSKPAKFRVVHQDKNSGFVVWRPVPRKGQVSLGDFACAKKASKAVMAGAVRCVAAWAVERCPVVECLWKEKQTGSQAIWSVQNGLGTFFGSLTGGRLSKREVTQGPQSRAERQKRKKKKKKKKKGSTGGDISEDEEAERIKLLLGVGEGWALRGVRASCIIDEWRQESDVITGPVEPCEGTIVTSTRQPNSAADEQSRVAEKGERSDAYGELILVPKPRPSVSWASWLLSFLLNHPSLRRLAMRPSLFRTLVAYVRSPGAPHRLRIVPLLTLLIRSHKEFEDGPPPLEDLDGLLDAVLNECDRATCGRGPGSAAWKPSDGPGGVQLETKWANKGLLLLTDLATATRRAQDSLDEQRTRAVTSRKQQRGAAGSKPGDTEGVKDVDVDDEQLCALKSEAEPNEEITDSVRVGLPPFGTRVDEGLEEEGEEEESEDVERSLADRVLIQSKSLRPEERALLEVDLRNALLPSGGDFAPVKRAENEPADEQTATVTTNSPSQCLHHLLEIMDTLIALRDGWPSPLTAASSQQSMVEGLSRSATRSSPYLDSILCEAWMDAVGPAAVIESDHPFRKERREQSLSFPGADELVVFLDPRSSMNAGTASLVLQGVDKIITLTGHQEAPWREVITFRGNTIKYQFVAETGGEETAGGSLVDDPGLDDWGFRFTIVAKGPVWEVIKLENDFDSSAETLECDAEIPDALSLLVEIDENHELPPECDVEVQGFSAEGEAVSRGLISESTVRTPVYVRGHKVRLIPRQKQSLTIDASADCKEDRDDWHAGKASSNVQEDGINERKIEADTTLEESLSDTDAMPDADAKLERLPSNTPVLRPWGEAAGVERRWRSPADETFDMERMALAGASYVSNTATVEVGDSDADSKDGSSNSVTSSTGERPEWTRYATLSDAIATGVPVLSAISSESSEAPPRGSSSGLRALRGAMSGTTSGSGSGGGSRDRRDARGMAAVEDCGHGEGDGTTGTCETVDFIVDDTRSERASTGSSRPRACAGAKDGPDEVRKEEKEGETETLPSGRKWSIKVRAAALPRKARLRLFLERRMSLPLFGPSLEQAREWMMMWTPEMDAGLLDLLGTAGSRPKESAVGRMTDSLNPWCCRLTRAEARFQQQRLAAVPMHSMHIRAALLLRLNDRIERVLPVIDLASRQEDSLGWQLREMNYLILPHIKNAVLEAALSVTQGPGDGVTVTLDNVKAMMSRDRGDKDLASSRCVFAQAYRQLRDVDPKVLRTVWDGERVFQINFTGEDGVDAGGVFREGMSRMVEDLFSPDFDLLIQCPNGRQAIGQNNEKYVPNPQHSSPLALSMLRLVGRLMGLSLRTRLCLPFQLPGMIWKRMLGLQVGFEDLRMVDTIICQFLTAIRTCEDDGLTSDEEFRDKYGERLFFTCTGSDGVERELTPGGSARRVTFHNRWTFCRMAEEARTHEFDAQAAAMAAGLSDIVPMKALRLFTAKQLEVAVAGEPNFDMAFWKEHTEYKGYRPEDTTVELFWKVMESMSAEDQSGFVRFAWGRSRLPPKSFWRVNMKLLRRNTSEDSLPVSHTCFFSIELPPYSTEDLMRKGLLTAIHFGMGGILNA